MVTSALRALFATLLIGSASVASADVCITIDESRDAFAQRDREAAVLLVTSQFEAEGERVAPSGCPKPYVLSHAQLGHLVVVTMSSPSMTWQATAQTLDDLPAIYSQMVRSIVTGRPMTGMNVIDRTNVASSQAEVRRVHSDSIWYGRVGYGGIFSDGAYGTAAFGFGFRAELDSLAIDVAFLNFQLSSGSYSVPQANAFSFLKLSGLRFVDPRANRSAYFGGGLSYGHGNVSRGNQAFDMGQYRTNWSGSGLQGELTAGYEFARATSLRVFVQADAVLPFYRLTSETRTTGGVVNTDSRYAPSLVLSIGIGR